MKLWKKKQIRKHQKCAFIVKCYRKMCEQKCSHIFVKQNPGSRQSAEKATKQFADALVATNEGLEKNPIAKREGMNSARSNLEQKGESSRDQNRITGQMIFPGNIMYMNITADFKWKRGESNPVLQITIHSS